MRRTRLLPRELIGPPSHLLRHRAPHLLDRPIDAASLLQCAAETNGRLITVEDHYATGGIGDAVAAAVAGGGFTVKRLAVPEIPRSGTPDQLLDHYGISARHIVEAVREL